MILKKGIGSFLAVSLLSIGTAAGASAASVEQDGPATINYENDISTSVETGNGQGASDTGYQFQAGKTTSSAAFTQMIKSKITLTSSNSSTVAEGETSQGATTEEPSHVVQSQVDRTSGIQFEKSFAGGPTIQFQQVQRTSINYSLVLKSVSPR